jgi:O-antigen/teichoic acid export membrane protein
MTPSLVLLAAIAAASSVVAVDAAGVPIAPLRILAGAFLAVWAPGAALLLAVRARFLGRAAAAALAVPLSIAILAVVGVVMDHTSLGLRPGPLALGTVIPSALLALVGDLRARGFERAIVGHLREPLFHNAYALALSGVLTSGLGLLYWAVAARLLPIEIVGVNAALLSVVMLLGNVAQLNLRSGFGRFVPGAGNRTAVLIAAGYGAAVTVAAVSAVVFLWVLGAVPGLLKNVLVMPVLAWLFPVTVVAWTAFAVQDHALTALRRTPIVPIENAVFGVLKIVALVALARLFPDYAILVSWTGPMLLMVLVVSGLVIPWIIPRHVAASRDSTAAAEPVTFRGVSRYLGVEYVASMLAIASTALLPPLVLALSGAASSAHFYVVTLIGSAAQLLPSVIATSLLVETSSARATIDRDVRRVLRQLLVLLLPAVAAIVVAAPWILATFGPGYAEQGTVALRLYAIAAIPYSLTQLAFVRLRIEKRVRRILAAQAALAVLLVAGSLLVLPVYGIAGIGAVLLASQTIVATFLVATELWPVLVPHRGQQGTTADDDVTRDGEAESAAPMGTSTATSIPEGTIADVAYSILSQHGGRMSVGNLVTELRRMGKLKSDGGASRRADYRTVYQALQRAPDRFIKQPGRGGFSLAAGTTPAPDEGSPSPSED